MVGQGTLDGDDVHIVDTMGLQHPLGHFGAGKGGGNLGVFLETALEPGLDDHAQHHHYDH